MKPLVVALVLLLTGAANHLYGQADVIEEEVEKIASDLARLLNKKGFSGALLVEPITNTQGQTSKLTMWISYVIDAQLANEGDDFWITENIEIQKGRGIDAGAILEKTIDIASQYPSLTGNETLDNIIGNGGSTLGDMAGNLLGGGSNNPYKGIDGVVNGVLIKTGDTYSLHLSASEIKRKKKRKIATADGEFVNASYTQEMTQKGGANGSISSPQIGGGLSTSGQKETFRKDPFVFGFNYFSEKTDTGNHTHHHDNSKSCVPQKTSPPPLPTSPIFRTLTYTFRYNHSKH